MSAYNHRRGQHVSQYIANLNAFPAQDGASESYSPEDASLDLFTNTEFLNNFDAGDSAIDNFIADDAAEDVAAAVGKDAGGSTDLKDLNADFGYQFGDMAFNPDAGAALHNIPSLQNINPPQQAFDVTYGSPSSYSPMTPHQPSTGDKRPFSSSSDPLEASSRAAAEEDKRRRNTAASARFRVKKKQREQALEKSAKEMTDKVDALEKKISDLERENSWLKTLVVDKAAGDKEEVASMLKKFTEETRSTNSKKKGVGTLKSEGEVA